MAQITPSIIIINFNTPDLVYDCLESIKKNLHTKYEVIVVDNGSKSELKIDDRKLKKIFADCKLIISEKNLGFGAGNNLGAKNAGGKYLWFLNSDTLLVDNSAEKLILFLENHPEVGAVSPLLYHENNILQKNFFASFQNLFSITFRRYNDRKIDFDKEFFYTDIVVGAAMMIKKEIFDKIGGFDENIFMYLEDDDICKRIESAGLKNAVYSKAKTIHLEGKSTKNLREKKKLYYASQTYFWRKHNGRLPTLIMRTLRWPYKTIRTR